MSPDEAGSGQAAPQAAYDMALWQLTEQTNSNRSFDTKAGAVLTVTAAFTGLFGASATGAVEVEAARWVAVVFGGLVLAVFGWTAFAFYKTVGPRHWARGPDARRLIEVAGEHEESRVRLWLADVLADSFIENEDALQEKARWFRRALYGAIAQCGATTAGLLAIVVAQALG